MRSDWSVQDHSRLRLLLTPGVDGFLAGGVDIELDPGWHTYWRNPGDSGVPPVFDFSGSENVADVQVRYPVPERVRDEAGVSLIYRDEVVFPLVVTPARRDLAVTLKVHASFGICREICLPATAAAEVALPVVAAADPLSETLLQQFAARVPGPPQPGTLAVERIAVQGDALSISVRTPESASADLFVEPPAGWYLGQPAFVSRAGDVSLYRLALEGKPRGAKVEGQRFRFVTTAGDRAVESELVIGR